MLVGRGALFVNIALLASTFLPRIGGAELAVHNLATQLAKMGHEVAVIAWWGHWRGVRGALSYPVRPLLPRSFTRTALHRLQAGQTWINPVPPQLALYQKRFRFDVWNIQHAFPLGVLATAGLRQRGIPVVITPQGDDVIHDPGSQYDLLENPRIRQLMSTCLRAAHRVTATSPAMRAAIEGLGVPPASIVDIPNGVSVERFTGGPDRRAETRRAHGLPADVPVILSVGRNHAQKGYDLIPPTMVELMRRNADCVWVIVGMDSDLVLKGVPSDVAARIRCLPPLLEKDPRKSGYDHLPSDGLIDLYRACDIYALPSRNEPFGMVVAEALAAGLPVVGTTGMGAPDMVAEGAGGFIVEKNNPAALAAKLEVLLRDKSLCERMGRYNREKARQYDWKVVARQYVACFEAAVADAGQD